MAHALDTTFYLYMYDDVPENSFLARKHYIYIGSKQRRFSSKFNFYVKNPLFKWKNNELEEIKDFIRNNNVEQDISINTTLNNNITKIPAVKPVQVLNYYAYTQTATEITNSNNEINNLLSIITELKEKINLLENNFDAKINSIYNNVDIRFNNNLDSIYEYLKGQIEYTNSLTENAVKIIENKVTTIENKVTTIEKVVSTDTNNLFSQITKLNSIIANINKENFT